MKSKSGIKLKDVFDVLIGRKSVVGLKSIGGGSPEYGKTGLISLADVGSGNLISRRAAEKLNEYYAQHYDHALDLEIIIKYIFGKKSGK